ncbi:protein of unknown function [Paraburkholderia dioscoreae]|uniref:Uncharacterized protein n=1 Tax=Paraburkholderia dioscoreae TaxID=2604047 RepID=A0A5Q4ZBB2_9BURK|nr:protein of unknown function [Paraburkholderia dioscoreae]
MRDRRAVRAQAFPAALARTDSRGRRAGRQRARARRMAERPVRDSGHSDPGADQSGGRRHGKLVRTAGVRRLAMVRDSLVRDHGRGCRRHAENALRLWRAAGFCAAARVDHRAQYAGSPRVPAGCGRARRFDQRAADADRRGTGAGAREPRAVAAWVERTARRRLQALGTLYAVHQQLNPENGGFKRVAVRGPLYQIVVDCVTLSGTTLPDAVIPRVAMLAKRRGWQLANVRS